MSTDLNLRRIEVILADIERLDAESGGQFRQSDDREAFDIASRIERLMRRKQKIVKEGRCTAPSPQG